MLVGRWQKEPCMVDGLAELLQTLPRVRSQVLPALHELHELRGYLDPDGIEEIGRWLHIPKSELYAVASSYTEFEMTPAAADAVAVCWGLSCRIAGADALAADLRAQGETVVEHECLFVCAVAPAIKTAAGVRGRAGTA